MSELTHAERRAAFAKSWYERWPDFVGSHDPVDWNILYAIKRKINADNPTAYDDARRWLRDTEIKPTIEKIVVDFIDPRPGSAGCRLCRGCHAINCAGACGRGKCRSWGKERCWAGRTYTDDHD